MFDGFVFLDGNNAQASAVDAPAIKAGQYSLAILSGNVKQRLSMHKIRAFPDVRVERECFGCNESNEAEICACASSTVVEDLLRRKAAIRQDAESRLRDGEMERDKLSLVACNTRDTVIIKDAEHRIEWVNDSFTRHYGYSLEECRGLHDHVLIGNGEEVQAEVCFPDNSNAPSVCAESAAPTESSASLLSANDPNDPSGPNARNGSARRRSEVIRCGKDGSKRWLAIECRPIINDDGEVAGFIEIEKDITERKKAEAVLLEEKRRAEAAIQAKSEFLAAVCHEIRNPVNVMIGMMDLTLQTRLTAEQRDYLNLMKTSSGVLSQVVNDLLDLSRIESGQLEAEHVPFSLRESMGNALKMFTFDAQRKGLVLAYDIAPDVPDALLGDPLRLGQIVINLVGNALKFTESGDIVLYIEREGNERNAGEAAGN